MDHLTQVKAIILQEDILRYLHKTNQNVANKSSKLMLKYRIWKLNIPPENLLIQFQAVLRNIALLGMWP